MKNLIALALAFLIGAACRWFELPVPAPPRIFGALLILAITVGYLATDTWLARPTPPPPEVNSRPAPPSHP